jgi:PAS domain S-box-containing protein
MDYDIRTKEDLIRELENLQRDHDELREEFDKDLSLIKLADEKFSKSEEKFRKAFMTSPDSININRMSDGLYVSINEGFTKTLGYTEEEIIGKTSLEMNIWADRESRDLLVKEIKLKSSVASLEARFRKKDGGIISGLMSATIIDLDGEPHLLTVTRDITQIKKTEEALESERNLLRTLIDNMPGRVYAKDINSRFIICNQSLVKRLGKSDQSEIIGKSDKDLWPEEIANKFLTDEINIMKSGEAHIDYEETIGNIDGTVRWSLTSKIPLKDTAGKIIGIVGMGQDITERKRRENESQVLFEITRGITATSNLDELLKLIHASLGKVVYAENCFIAMHDQKTGLFSFPYFVDKFDTTPSPTSMGKSCSAYVFRTVKPFIFSEDIFNELQAKNEVELVGSPSPSWIGIPLQTPTRVIGVLVLQHYEKENIYSEKDLKFLTSIGNQIAITIERKKAEEEIRLKNELLETVNAEKDKFFSIIAHDLRGPLSAFVEATQILIDDFQSMTTDEVRDITVAMKTDATNIYRLLENLLEWSRLQRGALEFKPKKLNLSKLVNAGVDSVAGSAKSKGIRLEIQIPEGLEVTADEHMIESILRNLVSNAIKFTPRNGNITILASSDAQNAVEVRVTDSGIGMSKDIIAKLFRINERTNRPGTEGEPSTGLGLLLCKEFIDKHRGSILVESTEGKGTTFCFTIPAKRES